MSSPQKTTMFGLLAVAAGFCCACAPPAMHNAAITRMSFFMVVPSVVERKDSLPIGFHADDNPVPRLRLVPGAVELADVRLAVVGELALGVVVVHEEHESPSRPARGELQHLQVAVGVAEGGDRAAADAAVDADRLPRAVVDEIELGLARERRLAALRLE